MVSTSSWCQPHGNRLMAADSWKQTQSKQVYRCYSKTVAESFERGSSSSRRTWLETSHHTTSAMRDLHWLPIVYRIKYNVASHAAANNNSPEYVTDILVLNSSLQERAALRSFTSGSYVVPRSKTEFGKRALCVAGHTAWNELPPQFETYAKHSDIYACIKNQSF